MTTPSGAPRTDAATLQISHLEPHSVVNGPGSRFVVWVQGCTIGCPGCFNPHTHDARGGSRIAVDELVQRILATPGIEGVTFSGGEPTEQPVPLSMIARRVRAAGLSVVCYTGTTLEALRRAANPAIAELLDVVDLLIDGPFVAARRSALPWRGSANQRLHLLSKRHVGHPMLAQTGVADVEFVVGERTLTTTGMFEFEFVEQLRRLLQGPSR